MDNHSPKLLVIRRDNIGDLVCTTPLFRALRSQLPKARIEALVTRYNAPVLAGNPDLDAVHAYVKAKHRDEDEFRIRIFVDRLGLIRRLRRERFDAVLLPGAHQASASRLARWIGAGRIIERDPASISDPRHEVELSCRLLEPLGLRYETPPLRGPLLPPRPASGKSGAPRIAIHISARRPKQRWPAERFAATAKRLHAELGASLVLLWAPGPENDPRHPGDDGKADDVLQQMKGTPIEPMPTPRLESLIAALVNCDLVICADGGAMHLAAALEKPVVCLFGDADPLRWRPWCEHHEILHTGSRDVSDLPVSTVVEAAERLMGRALRLQGTRPGLPREATTDRNSASIESSIFARE